MTKSQFRRFIGSRLALAAIVIGLAGCSGNGAGPGGGANSLLASSNAGAPLSAAERQIATDGVRQMIEREGGAAPTANIATMSATRVKRSGRGSGAAEDATIPRHKVCGHVRYRTGAGKSVEQQYFVEIGPETGKLAALRGQIASNEAKRAKVVFMCRRANPDG